MRVPAISTAILAPILTIAASAAMAQEGPDPSVQPRSSLLNAPATMPQAPIGHRQPRLSDLPPDLARAQRFGELSKSEATQSNETPSAPATNGAAGGNAARKLIDERLRICRGC
jgi:hypothetical protein